MCFNGRCGGLCSLSLSTGSQVSCCCSRRLCCAGVRIISVGGAIVERRLTNYNPLFSHTHDNAETYNIDNNRIAVAGDSAGGNIAAVVSLISRDRQGPKITFQSLIYPACDVASFGTTQKDEPFIK